ncbi:unnamed protein product, partial [Schistosoma mattheei]
WYDLYAGSFISQRKSKVLQRNPLLVYVLKATGRHDHCDKVSGIARPYFSITILYPIGSYNE